VTTVNLRDYAHVQLPSLYQQQIHLTKYSRWNDELGRRETWPETIHRYFTFMVDHASSKFGYNIPEETQKELYEAILTLKVMPSMRAMMTAGRALALDNAAAYNCAYVPVDRMQTHDESFYLSMCSVGVGFSVERQYTGKLPDLPRELQETETTIVVPDSRIGWASSYRQFLNMLYTGFIPRWDVSQVRPAGARLMTFGGRASGPEPLIDLFRYSIQIFKEAVENHQHKLTSIQNHDLMTKMAEVAVAGGVRRAAMISLSNPSDQRMRDAKSGEWWNLKPHYRLANNSGVWTDFPSSDIFLDEWLALIKSKSGERGIINRRALADKARLSRRIDVDHWEGDYGVNPCAEIILRPRQFCNLTTNIIRHDDGLRELCAKIRLSTILGTLQSTLTDFRYLSPEWRHNCEEERLLGVSLNGIMDNRFMSGLNYIREGTYLTDNFVKDGVKVELPEVLSTLRDVAVETNKDWANRLGINPSAAITTIKPEGNNSELVGCRSGLHGAHAPKRYIRTNRANKVDKLAQFMLMQGVIAEDDISSPQTAWVMYFPAEVPNGAVTRDDYSAIEHLKIWKIYQESWCEHKPSITVSVKDREWPSVGAFVYENWDCMSGVAFLPHDGGNYRQAPYITCTEKEYQELVGKTPKIIDWTKFSEDDDYTTAIREMACFGDRCDVV
jgi:ribonucleoside-triphosphate reductase (thioredoxin)